jgi:hypothetical protein
MPDIKKNCNMCNKELPLNDFHTNKEMKHGKSNRCKKCTLEFSRKRYWDNPDKFRKAIKKSQTTRREKGLCLSCGNARDGATALYCMRCANLKNISHKKRTKDYKQLVISHYGGECCCCGEKKIKFLTLDHKNNDGAAHRKSINRVQFYPWVIKNNYPLYLQILCWNCNLGKYHNNGICPHKEA